MIGVDAVRTMVIDGGESDVVVFVDDNDSCTSCDGCNNHAARRMVKKVIIRDEIMCFLLLGEASGSFSLALQIFFVVGVELVIISVCKT